MRPALRLRSGQAFKLARHEWSLVLRDPRFFIPFAAVPLMLIVLHGISLFVFSGNPLQGWALTRTFLSILSLVGASLAVPLGADTFAGEKERHTWETLLCLPVPRGQLFMGKVLGILPFPLVVAWSGQIIILALSSMNDGLKWALPMEWIFPLLLTPFLSLFFSALSVLISLRCETVRTAAQFTGLSLLVLFPVITVASQAWSGSPMYLVCVLVALLLGAAICFGMAAKRLNRI